MNENGDAKSMHMAINHAKIKNALKTIMLIFHISVFGNDKLIS